MIEVVRGSGTFICGGTRENPLMIIHSEDKGKTWSFVELL
jgi:hypothetical protein